MCVRPSDSPFTSYVNHYKVNWYDHGIDGFMLIITMVVMLIDTDGSNDNWYGWG